MEKKALIYQKLESFIKKFYTNELIKGIILFLGIGLLYFIFTFLIEYFLWLSTIGRTFLFWLFIVVETILFFRFILFPVFKLFKIQKGLNYNEASKIIGEHFTQVKDKLINFLQLAASTTPTELVLASIDQKANNLQPIPFGNAINFKKNKRFLPIALIPILSILYFYISGNAEVVNNSFTRVVEYDKNFEKPAAFKFNIVTNPLMVEQNKSFKLIVKTQGTVIPENASIVINNESYFLEKIKSGEFFYQFDNVQKSVQFHLVSNEIISSDYELKVISVPTISSFDMVLNYPSYLNKPAEVLKGTGNAVIPEGTTVSWKMTTFATTNVTYTDDVVNNNFIKANNFFSLSKRIIKNTDYQIKISNSQLKDYESLQYKLTILKDQFPSISATTTPDTLKLKQKVIIGQVSDDYGLSRLSVIYYDKNKPNVTYRKNLILKNKLVDQFIYSFPDGLDVKDGVPYDYYFEVTDNDVVNGLKSSKSSVFSFYELTEEEKTQKSLEEQNSNINSLSKALNKQDTQNNELEKLEKLNKQKDVLDYKDQKKIDDFIKRQKDQENMMKEFSEKIKDNLQNFKTEDKVEVKKELLDRLEKAEQQAKKNEKLLDELDKLNKKLEKDELFKKTDEFKKNAKTQQKSLEQLVELTKRFYVEEKAKQLMDKLDKLADKQDELSKKDNPSIEEQKKINDQFQELKKELNELDKNNQELKKPMDIPNEKEDQKEAQDKLNKAEENLQKKDTKKAKENQKAAAKKMKEMGNKMGQEMDGGEQDAMEEDTKVLRQILDNLLAYSFDQEKLVNQVKNNPSNKTGLNDILKKQQDLKLQFKHIDDSIFSLSLRQPKISEMVLKDIEEVHYNIDKSLENLITVNKSRGIANQKTALNAANKLADYLSDMQNSMNMSMSASSGKSGKPKPGKGKGDQLSDIIQKQKSLGDKMKEGQKSQKPGDKPGDKPGESGKPGEKGKNGQNGEAGEDGNEGQAGKVLDILKQQQELRESLEKELQKEGLNSNGQNALNQMKELEKQLLNKGFSNDIITRALNINHELLKLESAKQKQGQDTKREANTNSKDFLGNNKALPPALLNYLKSVEILNRQSLPLQPNFNNKVQQYFKSDDKF